MSYYAKNELLSCPFCGSDKLTVTQGVGTYYTICGRCGCRGPRYKTQSEAEQAWNMRIAPKTVKSIIEHYAEPLFREIVRVIERNEEIAHLLHTKTENVMQGYNRIKGYIQSIDQQLKEIE